MRLVFLGTAMFAVPSLRACADHHEVVAVATQPDKPGDRGKPAPRPVADEANALGIPLLTPRRIRDADAVAEIAALQPECLVVAAYGQILPQALLQVPSKGPVNVHASLLPRWRGASPVAHAILAGDSITGVTIMRMDAGLDTGPIYAQRTIEIPARATTPSLTDVLAEEGALLLDEVLRHMERGDAETSAQPDDGVTGAPRLRRADGELRWNAVSAVELDRRVRGLQPWPGVTVPLASVLVRILEGDVDDRFRTISEEPGAIIAVERDSLDVATKDGAYRVDRVLPPGSRAMTAAAFLRGRRVAN